MSDRLQHRPAQSPDRTRRGFTLVEILIVLSIIVLMVAAAVPAIRYIIGSHSTESATNVVSAYLGRARSEAIQNQQTEGVFFFLDPDTDRTTLTLVVGGRGIDLQEYSGWTDGQLEYRGVQAPVGVTYYDANTPVGPANVVTMLKRAVVGNGESGPFADSQFFLTPYSCSKTHSPAKVKPYSNPVPTNPPDKNYWQASGERFIELADGTDFQLLPTGVALQVVNDPKYLSSTGYSERYLRTGCILFDSYGRFQSVPWAVGYQSALANKIAGTKQALKSDIDFLTGPSGSPSLYSGFGVVLYDRQVFKNTTTARNGEYDYLLRNILPGITTPKSVADETSEEGWLDNNTLPLMLNHQNGTLIKGE